MEPVTNDIIIQLLPLLFMWVVLAIVGFFIARRKGIGLGMFALGIFLPWAGLFVIWWASLTDKAVLDRLAELEGRR